MDERERGGGREGGMEGGREREREGVRESVLLLSWRTSVVQTLLI